MSILVDYNGIVSAAIFATSDISEGLVRHSFLNSLRSIRSKFKNDYGELIIACDSANSWRKDYFKHYKVNRSKSTQIDKEVYYGIINNLKNELETYFPYKVVSAPRSEGDDIIAVLAMETSGPHLIASNDKDMVQLNSLSDIKVYSPLKENYLVPTRDYTLNKQKVKQPITPEEYLQDHIIKGDRSDGIPNILTEDDVFVSGKYQNSTSRQMLETFNYDNLDENTKNNFKRNKKLISLFEIPNEIRSIIIDKYNACEVKGHRGDLLNYFIMNGLNELSDKLGDF